MDVAPSGTETLMTVGDAARLLELSTSRVRQLVTQGRLDAVRTVSGIRLFRRVDVEKLISQRREQLVQVANKDSER